MRAGGDWGVFKSPDLASRQCRECAEGLQDTRGERGQRSTLASQLSFDRSAWPASYLLDIHGSSLKPDCARVQMAPARPLWAAALLLLLAGLAQGKVVIEQAVRKVGLPLSDRSSTCGLQARHPFPSLSMLLDRHFVIHGAGTGAPGPAERRGGGQGLCGALRAQQPAGSCRVARGESWRDAPVQHRPARHRHRCRRLILPYCRAPPCCLAHHFSP